MWSKSEWTTVIGTLATVIGVVVQFPQTYTIYRNRSVDNINVCTYLLWLFGSILWIIYAVLQDDSILIISSSFSIATALLILFMYLIFRRKPNTNDVLHLIHTANTTTS